MYYMARTHIPLSSTSHYPALISLPYSRGVGTGGAGGAVAPPTF